MKGTGDDAWVVAASPQVTKYWGRYSQVLVTNYRDFVLVGHDADHRQATLDPYRLAPCEADFWRAAGNARETAARIEESFVDFLMRVMRSAVPLDSAQDLAWFLASYARQSKFRIETGDFPALATVRTALEEALGMTFEGATTYDIFLNGAAYWRNIPSNVWEYTTAPHE